MPNKTIYVSRKDAPVFEEARTLAGEALSSVIARALREYVARHRDREKGMQEVSARIGPRGSEREKRFVAVLAGKWQGLSDDREWRLEAAIYRTRKGNWAVLLDYKGKMSVVTHPKDWISNGDYLVDPRYTELVVAAAPEEFGDDVPHALKEHIRTLAAASAGPVDYLAI